MRCGFCGKYVPEFDVYTVSAECSNEYICGHCFETCCIELGGVGLVKCGVCNIPLNGREADHDYNSADILLARGFYLCEECYEGKREIGS